MTGIEINRSMTATQWGMLVLLSLVWGGSFFFVGVLVDDLPPFTIVFFRVLIAALALLIFIRVSGRELPLSTSAWIAFFGMGLLNNAIPFSLIVWGQTHIASGVASILNATMPLFTVVIAHVLTEDEKMTGTRMSGVIVGLLGVAVMIGGGARAEGVISALAHLALIGGAVAYAFASIFGRRFKRMKIDPYCVATGQLTASTLIMLPMVLMIDRPWELSVPSTTSMAALVALGVISSAFAYILYFKVLEDAGATNTSLVTFLVPVSAIFLGIVFLNEQLLMRHVLGLALIASGLVLVDGRLFRRWSG